VGRDEGDPAIEITQCAGNVSSMQHSHELGRVPLVNTSVNNQITQGTSVPNNELTLISQSVQQVMSQVTLLMLVHQLIIR